MRIDRLIISSFLLKFLAYLGLVGGKVYVFFQLDTLLGLMDIIGVKPNPHADGSKPFGYDLFTKINDDIIVDSISIEEL